MNPQPEFRLQHALVRPWRSADAQALTRHADDRGVWRNMRDLFPHPYGLENAREWLANVVPVQPVRMFAIEVEGESAGGIGVTPLSDVYRRGGEIGYWLGRAHWNRGIASEAVAAITAYAFETLELVRLEAAVFAWNPASMRVLERCGYRREGVRRHGAFKDGEFVDCVLYARLKAE